MAEVKPLQWGGGVAASEAFGNYGFIIFLIFILIIFGVGFFGGWV